MCDYNVVIGASYCDILWLRKPVQHHVALFGEPSAALGAAYVKSGLVYLTCIIAVEVPWEESRYVGGEECGGVVFDLID